MLKKTAFIVPVKGKDHKSRLSGEMGAEDRVKLCRLLLLDVLRTITLADVSADMFVVSSSQEMLDLSRKEGAQTIKEDRDGGVNRAVELASRKLGEYQELVVLPADLPLLLPADLRRAIALKTAGMEVVISPSSSFNGTNMLIFSRQSPLKLSYDRDSFWNHLADAADQGLSVAVYATKGILVDVDTYQDVVEVVKTRLHRKSVEFLRRIRVRP